MILFSIIMPVYNVEKFIRKSITSVLNQTYKNFELIIVDDGSKDESIKIAREMTKNINNVKILHKENGGLADARNFGLNYAQGKYVWFIDSDDYIRKDSLKILSENVGADIISFGYYKDINNKIIPVKIKNINYCKTTRYLLNSPSATMKIYKRNFLEKNKIKFEKGKYYEDLGLTPWLIKYTKNIEFIEDELYYYVIRENSIMTKKEFNSKKDDRFWAINKIIENLGNEYLDEIEYIAIKQLIVMYSIDILKLNKEVYKSRIKKVNLYFKSKFPNYLNNKYLKEDGFFTRLFVRFYRLKLIYLCKLMIIIGGY